MLDQLIKDCYESIKNPVVVVDGQNVIYRNSSASQLFGLVDSLESLLSIDINEQGTTTCIVTTQSGNLSMTISIGKLSQFFVLTFNPSAYFRYSLEFKQLDILGKGGFGVVYRALNILDGQEYAVKKVKLSCEANNVGFDPEGWLQQDSEVFEFSRSRKLSASDHRMLREVKTLASVSNHPNIIRYFNSWIEPVNPLDEIDCDPDESDEDQQQHCSTLFIQMEMAKHKDLRTWIKERGNEIDPEINMTILQQLIIALAHIHRHNVIHRDVKPENIFMNDHHIVLGDFGLAKQIEEHLCSGFEISEGDTSTEHGTSTYIAPEISQGKKITVKSDMYSLGIVLFELYYPFSTDMERYITINRLKKDRIFPDGMEAEFPSVCELIKDLLDVEPVLRPSSEQLLHRYSLFMGNVSLSGGSTSLETKCKEIHYEMDPGFMFPPDQKIQILSQSPTDSKYSADSLPRKQDRIKGLELNIATLQTKIMEMELQSARLHEQLHSSGL